MSSECGRRQDPTSYNPDCMMMGNVHSTNLEQASSHHAWLSSPDAMAAARRRERTASKQILHHGARALFVDWLDAWVGGLTRTASAGSDRDDYNQIRASCVTMARPNPGGSDEHRPRRWGPCTLHDNVLCRTSRAGPLQRVCFQRPLRHVKNVVISLRDAPEA